MLPIRTIAFYKMRDPGYEFVASVRVNLYLPAAPVTTVGIEKRRNRPANANWPQAIKQPVARTRSNQSEAELRADEVDSRDRSAALKPDAELADPGLGESYRLPVAVTNIRDRGRIGGSTGTNQGQAGLGHAG